MEALSLVLAAGVALVMLIVTAMAAANTFAGGRFIGDERLPGRNLYFAVPLVFVISWIAVPWAAALAWALGYLFWRSFAWGHLIGMGHFMPLDRQPSPVERFCLWAGGQHPYWAMAVRELLAIPAFVAVGVLIGAPWFGASVMLYALWGALVRHVAWKWAEADAAVMWGEVSEGALWGFAIVVSGFLFMAG